MSNATAAPTTGTADNGAFDSGTVNAKSSTTMTLTNPGGYPFHCSIQTLVTGTMTVTWTFSLAPIP